MQEPPVPMSVPVQLGASLVLPLPMVERMVSERLNYLEATQKNNHIVGLSMLISAVVSFLQFERCFKSMLGKGDCSTQIATLKYAINGLRTANQSYDAVLDKQDPIKFLITEPEAIVDIRELFLHCINILVLMLQLLGSGDAKSTGSGSTTGGSMTWIGWQQVSHHIMRSNNALFMLLLAKQPSSVVSGHQNMIFNEVKLFSLCVSHLTDSIFESKYPSRAQIIKIYEDAKCDIQRYIKLDTALASSESVGDKATTQTTKSTSNQEGKTASWF